MFVADKRMKTAAVVAIDAAVAVVVGGRLFCWWR